MTEYLSLRGWVRQHSRVSVHTLRRRLRLTEAQADDLITELVQGRALGREPEAESYRVLYRRELYLRHIVRTSPGAAGVTVPSPTADTLPMGSLLPRHDAVEVGGGRRSNEKGGALDRVEAEARRPIKRGHESASSAPIACEGSGEQGVISGSHPANGHVILAAPPASDEQRETAPTKVGAAH